MSSRSIAIRARGLGKAYTIRHHSGDVPTTLGEAVVARLRHPFRRATQETLWALEDLSIDVARGDILGVVGRNGAGKSTLLKILSGITEPTSGEVELHGRVGSLLEVGTGFHHELTGRENIFLNGAILGMTRAEIRREFDAIVDFSGVEQFLDTPVKRFSSGMYVRLAFAVAAHLRTEILLVDEVLAVGDAAFQKKCLGAMESLSRTQGRTIVLVSHNMSAVRHLCTRGLFLERGRVLAAESLESCIGHYLRMPAENGAGLAEATRSGDGRLQFVGFHVEDDHGDRVTTVPSGAPCTLVFDYVSRGDRRGQRVDVGFGIHAPTGERLLLLYASHVGHTFGAVHEAGQFRCRLPALPLASGRYGVYPRIEIDGKEADFPLDGVGVIDVEELDFYGTGKPMGSHGHAQAYYLTLGEWSERRAPDTSPLSV